MIFHVLTLFPEMIRSGCDNSILKRAMSKDLISVNAVDIRDFTQDKHGKVDDYTYGGGAGMLMQAQPVYDAWRSLADGSSPEKPLRTIYVTPQGTPFTQKMAEDFAKESQLVFLCGHYEGIDERVLEKIVTDRVSIGDYVLTGGELPAMVMIDAVSRLVPGVLNNEESAETESFQNDLLEYPQYSRPEEWMGKKVPAVLLTGDHKKIQSWRIQEAEKRTQKWRPDLYEKYQERQRLAKILEKQKKENAYLVECLRRGEAEVLYAEKDQVIALNKRAGVLQICCSTPDAGIRLLDHAPKSGYGWLIHNCEELNPYLEEKCGYKVQNTCYQAVYTQHTNLPIACKDIRRLSMEELGYAAEHSEHADEAYLKERIQSGEMFGAYVEGKLAGFAGMHDDGSLGILYVEPEYRRLKLGSSLAAYLVNKALERGGLPYAHIEVDNLASLKMQEKMGMYVGKKKVFWLHKENACKL